MATWLLIFLVLGGLLLLAGLLWGLFWFLVKIGVIVNAARKPPYVDSGDYSLEQGRDVGAVESVEREPAPRDQ